MDTNTSPLSESSLLGNVEGEDLARLEQQWELQGKPPARKRWLRYYYKNRQRFLAKRIQIKKGEVNRIRITIRDGEYIEKVEIHSGLLT